jgi:hypothetical protein
LLARLDELVDKRRRSDKAYAARLHARGDAEGSRDVALPGCWLTDEDDRLTAICERTRLQFVDRRCRDVRRVLEREIVDGLSRGNLAGWIRRSRAVSGVARS